LKQAVKNMRVLPATVRSVLAVTAVTLVMSSDAPNAQARDFFSSFFNALSGRPPEPAQPALGYNGAGDSQFPPSGSGGRSTA